MGILKNTFASQIFLSIIPILFLIGAVFMQLRYDAIRAEYFNIHAAEHRYALPAPIIRNLSFGFQNFLADYYWVTTIQALNKWDRYDAYVPEYFRTISTLDPKFTYPYIFAALVVPTRVNPGSLEWLAEIAEEGMRTNPNSWEIPYYTGMQFHVIGRSYEQATRYLAIAASKPNVPEYVRASYAIYLMKSSTDYQRSRALFTAIYQSSENEETKRIMKERIELLDLIEVLDQAVKKYYEKYSKYPLTVTELSATLGIEIPTEIITRFRITIDQKTGKISSL